MGKDDDALKRHLHALEARDQTQRAALAALGAEFGRRRKIDLTFRADTEPDARALVEALQRNGITDVADPVECGGRWLIAAAMMMSIDLITTRDTIATFVLIADKYDGEYDGWGTEVVETLERRIRPNDSTNPCIALQSLLVVLAPPHHRDAPVPMALDLLSHRIASLATHSG